MKTKVNYNTSDLKNKNRKAISAIVFFIVSYVVLVILALGLTALCVFGGFMLVVTVPKFITLMLGIGLASMGLLIFVFLVKFIFKSHKPDYTHLVEIKRKDEPQLFALIDDIVTQVETSFPKKVYLSPNVNASVFYNSGFWSMFFPVRKNLNIGVGLINSVTQDELKAILAHEFGHFSQKTMRTGSYVYYVNQVIYNMLYDNTSYGAMLQKFADASAYFLIFVTIATQIINGIQAILQKLYEVVNKNYLGLSREMEFEADAIAASVTGYEPLCTSLLRLSLADHAWNLLLSVYNSLENDGLSTKDFYKEHEYVLLFLAKDRGIEINNNLPQVTIDWMNRFNGSKLNIENQWASHPSTEDRITRLEQTGILAAGVATNSAFDLIVNPDKTKQHLTKVLFKEVSAKRDKYISFEEFEILFQRYFEKNTFSPVYNEYYEFYNPETFDVNEVDCEEGMVSVSYLFSTEKVQLAKNFTYLKDDLNGLKQIAAGKIPVKSFDYEGIKYESNHAKKLIKSLTVEFRDLQNKVLCNDKEVYCFFKTREKELGLPGKIKTYYKEFFKFSDTLERNNVFVVGFFEKLRFVSHELPAEQIKLEFRNVEYLEQRLRHNLSELFEIDVFKDYLNDEFNQEYKESIQKFLDGRLIYFKVASYDKENLNILFTALNCYRILLSDGVFIFKRQILKYQVALLEAEKEKSLKL